MRILHTVESYLPLRHGMQEVVSQISERLARKGHKVTVATSYHPERKESSINGVVVECFSVSGNMVNGYGGDDAERRRYQEFLCGDNFDVVVNFAAQQWATDLALPILDNINAKKVFVPTGFSGLHLEKYSNYFLRMPAWMRQYDMNVFLSDTYRDARFADEHHIENRTLIPNGASEEEFCVEYPFSIRERLGISKEIFLIILVGSHTGMKGHKEAVEIFDRAGIKNASLLVVSNHIKLPLHRSLSLKSRLFLLARSLHHSLRNECPDFCTTAEPRYNNKKTWRANGKSLFIREFSREETVRAYQEADLFLFPSRVECSPIVLFEAAASRTPFLSTDVGNAAEIAQWTGGGSILPTTIDAKGYAHAEIEGTTKMLEDLWSGKDRKKERAEEAYDAWRERFTWEKIADRYESLYTQLVGRGGDGHALAS